MWCVWSELVWQNKDIHTYTLSIIFWKCTSTVQLSTSLCLSELWIRTESFFDLIFWALYPNTKSIESMTLDFPLPFGPMMQEKRWERGKNRNINYRKYKQHKSNCIPCRCNVYLFKQRKRHEKRVKNTPLDKWHKNSKHWWEVPPLFKNINKFLKK